MEIISSKHSSHNNNSNFEQSFKDKQVLKFSQSCQQFNIPAATLSKMEAVSPSLQESEGDFDQYDNSNLLTSKRNQTLIARKMMEQSKHISQGQSVSHSTSRKKEDQYLFTFNKLGSNFIQTQTAGFKTNSSHILNSTMKTTAKLQKFNPESESQHSQIQIGSDLIARKRPSRQKPDESTKFD